LLKYLQGRNNWFFLFERNNEITVVIVLNKFVLVCQLSLMSYCRKNFTLSKCVWGVDKMSRGLLWFLSYDFYYFRSQNASLRQQGFKTHFLFINLKKQFWLKRQMGVRKECHVLFECDLQCVIWSVILNAGVHRLEISHKFHIKTISVKINLFGCS